MFSFFKNHFRKREWSRLSIPDVQTKKISVLESKALEEEFSKEEVRLALCDCDENKAPGPEGINLCFVKANWDLIKVDFMTFLSEFNRDGSVVKAMNCTFIALIPKLHLPASSKDYRPISLVSSLYKVLAKVLANTGDS